VFLIDALSVNNFLIIVSDVFYILVCVHGGIAVAFEYVKSVTLCSSLMCGFQILVLLQATV